MLATRFLELVDNYESALGVKMLHAIPKAVDDMLTGVLIHPEEGWYDAMFAKADYTILVVVRPRAVTAAQRYLLPSLCADTYTAWLADPPPSTCKAGTQYLHVALTLAALDARIQAAILSTMLAYMSDKALPVCKLLYRVDFECASDRAGITFGLTRDVRGLMSQLSESVRKFLEAHGYSCDYDEKTKRNCVYALRK